MKLISRDNKDTSYKSINVSLESWMINEIRNMVEDFSFINLDFSKVLRMVVECGIIQAAERYESIELAIKSINDKEGKRYE